LKGVLEAVKPFGYEVLVIDGHSKDDTRQIARDSGVKVEMDNGRGKGDGIKTGIKFANGDLLVFIDADGSHEIGDIPKLIAPISKGEADLVIGSRMLGGSDELYGTIPNFVRMMGASLVALGINYRWSVHLTDPENGFRAIKKDVAMKLNLKSNDFDIEQEMVMKAVKSGYRVKEVSSHEYERKGGSSKLPTGRGWKFIWRFLLDIW